MADSFLKMLEIMGTGKKPSIRNGSNMTFEPINVDAPQLKLAPDFGNKLEEVLSASLTMQPSPMDSAK